MEKKYIKDKQGNKVLPITHVSAVLDDNGNNIGSVMGAFEDEVRGLVDTPHQEYVTVDAYASLPATGSKDTIYRVSNYNGSTSQVDASVYSEYAWNGTQYIFLCVKSQIGEVFDISVYNNNAKYTDLADALGTNGEHIPQSLQKGGMSVKFVQSSDNKYVQYRLMSDTFNTTPSNWQGVDDILASGSKNLPETDSVVVGLQKLPMFYGIYSIQIDVWQGTQYNHIVIPVSGGEVLKNNDSHNLYYALLTEYNHAPVQGETPAFLTGYIGRQTLGTSTRTFTIPNGTKFLVINNPFTLSNEPTINNKPFIQGIWQTALTPVDNNIVIDGSITWNKFASALQSALALKSEIVVTSITTEERILSKNIANPDNISDGIIDSSYNLSTSDTWKVIKLDVTPGQVISFGGIYLGRKGYGRFQKKNGDFIYGLGYDDPNGGYNIRTVNITVPEGAEELYLDIKTNVSPSDPYSNLMINFGDTVLPYEPYQDGEFVTEINNTPLAGDDEDLRQELDDLEADVDSLEGTVSQHTTAIGGLNTRVSNLEMETTDIIADLPVSADGSDIEVGYAYINSSTGVVTVKLS